MMVYAGAPDSHSHGAEWLPLGRFTIYQSEEVDKIQRHMCQAFRHHRIIVEGKRAHVVFRHNCIDFSDLCFNAIDYGQSYEKITLDIYPGADNYILLCPLIGHANLLIDGKEFELLPEQVYLLRPEVRASHVFGPGYKHLAVTLPRENIENIFLDDLGISLCDLKSCTSPIGIKGETKSLSHLIATICHDVNEEEHAYAQDQSRRAIVDTIRRLIVGAFPPAHTKQHSNRSLATPYYVKRAEKFIRDHKDEPDITLKSLTIVSGVSARSLHSGFRRFRNTTPLRYLKEQRLGLARSTLMQTVDQRMTVSDVAIASGFTHLSKFAQDYKAYFGELPSCTLRQKK